MSEEATIRRGVRNARYTTVPNHVFEDIKLSMEARWLLGYLLSKPDGWIVRLTDIRKKGGCGRDKARAMVAELVEARYAEREEARKDGKFAGLALVIYDEPKDARTEPTDDSVASLPQPEKPATVLPATVNPPLVKTEDLATPDSSFERERGRDPSIGSEGRQEAASAANAHKSVERAFEKAWRDWPSSIGDSRPAALKAWLALSPAEREAGAAEATRYLDAVRAVGRKIPCAFGKYLAEKRWEGLPEKQMEPAQPVPAPAFGPVWSAVRMRMLLEPPLPSPAPASRFIADLVAQNDAAGRAERMKRQAIYGWPSVNGLHEGAANRRGISVVAGSQAEQLGALMEPVPVGSPMFDAWRAEHERRGWPWLPDPGAMPVVYFPAGGPEGLQAFEAALRGNHHDGAGQEAAE